MSIDTQKIIEEFKRGEGDTGSPEVQVAHHLLGRRFGAVGPERHAGGALHGFLLAIAAGGERARRREQ